MAEGAPRVLVIEDDDATRELVETVLSDEGYVCESVRSADDAVGLLLRSRALIAGLDDARALEYERSRIPRPLLVLSADRSALRYASRVGARYLGKPFEIDELTAAVHALVRGDRERLRHRAV